MDSRIRTLVENCVKTRQRSLYIIVGDKGRDQASEEGVGACTGKAMRHEDEEQLFPRRCGTMLNLR